VLDLGSGTPRHGVTASIPPSTAAVIALAKSWYALCTVAGDRPRPVSDVTQARTSRCVIASSGTAPNLGSTYSRNTISFRVRVLGRRLTVVAHHSSNQARNRTRPCAGSTQVPLSLAASISVRYRSASLRRVKLLARSRPVGSM